MDMTTSTPPVMVNGRRAEYLAENLLLKLEIDGRGAPDLSPLAQSRCIRLR
jgi:hypothetical protein